MVGGYFGYYALYQNSAVPVAVTVPHSKPVEQPVASRPESETRVVAVANESTVSSSETRPATGQKQDRYIPGSRTRGADDSTGGFYDIGGGQVDPKRIFKRDQSTPSLQDLSPVEGGPGISPKDVLETFGIRADFDSTGWKVASVKPNSVAYKAGVKAGDIVEALNDQPLTDRTVLGRKVTGTSVRVRRDGQSIKLELKP
jgi:C-terminal processing protease CtpA/Prc